MTKDIEKYGSGYIRIRKEISEYQTMTFEYKEVGNGFLAILKYENRKLATKTESRVGEKVGEKVVEKVVENLSENQKQIIEFVRRDNYITAMEIAREIGISHRKVQENMAKLKEMGILKRIGPAKGGHWEIILK